MLAVVGTTGSNEENEKISSALYENAYDILIDTMYEAKDFDLISNGCAFSNHLAVRAFNEGIAKSLTLCLPAELEENVFSDTKYGKIANHHHKTFMNKCGINSFVEIQEAINKGAKVIVFKDFLQAGNEIVKLSNKLIAFTFSNVIIDDCIQNMRCRTNIQLQNIRDLWFKAKTHSFKRHVGYRGMRGFNE